MEASTSERARTPSGGNGDRERKKSHAVLYPWSYRTVSMGLAQRLATKSKLVEGTVSASPFPRVRHTLNAGSLGQGDVFMFGGGMNRQPRNELYMLDTRSAASKLNGAALSLRFVETTGHVPAPRMGHASVGVGNVLIVWGGDMRMRSEDRLDSSLYLLNLNSCEWTRVRTVDEVPEGRYGHTLALVGSKIYLFGGQTNSSTYLDDLCWFDLQGLKMGTPRWSFWTPGENKTAPPKRSGHSMVAYGDMLFVFGGSDGQYHYNDMWQFDTVTETWRELACIGYIPSPRKGHAAVLHGDVMYIFGGRSSDGRDLDDLAAFKLSTFRWFMFHNMGAGPTPRSGHAMVCLNGKIYVVGGSTDATTVHVLDTSRIKYPSETKSKKRRDASKDLEAAESPGLGDTSKFPDASKETSTKEISSSRDAGVKDLAPASPNTTGTTPGSTPLMNQSAIASPVVTNVPSAPSTDTERLLKIGLSAAIQNGFATPKPDFALTSDLPPQTAEALVALKRQLAALRLQVKEAAIRSDDAVARAEAGRLAALGEMTYLRAKLDTGTRDDPDQRRVQELEEKLTESLNTATALEKRVEQLESDVQFHADLRVFAETRAAETLDRARALEKANTTLTSTSKQQIEQLRAAHAAAHERADDLESALQTAHAELAAAREEHVATRATLERESNEKRSAVVRLDDAHRSLRALRSEIHFLSGNPPVREPDAQPSESAASIARLEAQLASTRQALSAAVSDTREAKNQALLWQERNASTAREAETSRLKVESLRSLLYQVTTSSDLGEGDIASRLASELN